MNILVATPGRLLQHMDETPYFECTNLSVLVLDEADRILDMGFSATLDAIIDFLPRSRQTLLFSATQTRRVADLARLSLRDAEYVSVHEHAASATPPRLVQMVSTVALGDKMHALWGFIKTHLTHKTLVFFASCRQVAFAHEALRQLRPGVPLRALHGRMKQPRRMGAFYDFCNAPAMVLLATDVAARGLDFPAVDWVLQVDCPEDVAAYIHRVGRTARYTAAGKALLLLEPSESAFLPQLAAAKVPYSVTKLNLARMPPVTAALAGLLSADADLKATAQRAVASYLRSVHVMPNKAVFDVTKLDAAAFAASLGLTNAPRLRFLARERGAAAGGAGAAQHDAHASGSDLDGDGEDDDEHATRGAAPGAAQETDDDPTDSGDELLAVKRANHVLSDEEAEDDDEAQAALRARLGLPAAVPADVVPAPSKARKVKLHIKAGGVASRSRGAKIVFDADGTPRAPLEALAIETRDDEGAAGENAEQPPSGAAEDYRAAVAARYAATAAARAAGDAADKRRERELRRAKKLERKRKLKARAAGGGGGTGAVLGAPGDSDESGSDEYEEDEEAQPFERHEAPQPPLKKRKAEPAHAGMARVRPGASIAELEAAALARLTGGE